MLTCSPRSPFSSTYGVEGTSSETWITFNFFGQQGSILTGNGEYLVQKQGWLSGEWTLERSGEVCARALKLSPLFRSFELSSGDLSLTLRAQSPLSRCFEIANGADVVGTVRPVHHFTRKACVECDPAIPEIVQLFAFWLVALMWRRAGGGGGG